jgi:hypothetical protein
MRPYRDRRANCSLRGGGNIVRGVLRVKKRLVLLAGYFDSGYYVQSLSEGFFNKIPATNAAVAASSHSILHN